MSSSNRHQELLEWLAQRHGTITIDPPTGAANRSYCFIKWPVAEGTRVIVGSSVYPQVALRKAINSWCENHEDMAH
jgi:hypothetical protein